MVFLPQRPEPGRPYETYYLRATAVLLAVELGAALLWIALAWSEAVPYALLDGVAVVLFGSALLTLYVPVGVMVGALLAGEDRRLEGPLRWNAFANGAVLALLGWWIGGMEAGAVATSVGYALSGAGAVCAAVAAAGLPWAEEPFHPGHGPHWIAWPIAAFMVLETERGAFPLSLDAPREARLSILALVFVAAGVVAIAAALLGVTRRIPPVQP